MNKILLFTMAGLITLASCTKERVTGSGATITEDRSVANFTKVSTSGSTDIHITQGAAFKVQVKGYENLIPYLETRVANNTLEIGYKNRVNVKNDNVEVFVTLPGLEGVHTSGSGDIDVKGAFAGNGLTASLSGSGTINIEQGSMQSFTSSISGSGNIKAFGLVAQRADVSISGSGSTEVQAINTLKVNISGSGTVYYKGQPVIETFISGSGQLVHR